jgi:hypothetical protein
MLPADLTPLAVNFSYLSADLEALSPVVAYLSLVVAAL